MGNNLYRVKVREYYKGKYPQSRYDLVMATGPHEALDKVKDSLEGNSDLYDEDIQRAIVDHEISEKTVERKYSDYITKVEYIE